MTIELTVYSPFIGEEIVVNLEDEELAYEEIDIKDGESMIVTRRNLPSEPDDSWIEIQWSLTQDNEDYTVLESDAGLEMYCPVCSTEVTVQFDGDEFEDLHEYCSNCSSELIRDDPTEAGQRDMVNYTILVYE